MKTFQMLILTMAAAACVTSVASANPVTPRVDRREVRQHERIQQGVRSGELTRGERMRLAQGQVHVRGMERRFKSDGVVSPRERARLAQAQNRQSRHIWRFKHNERTR